jgi:L-lactate dehydrogenase complex protein LldG
MNRDVFLARVATGVRHAELPDPPLVPADLPDLGEADLLEMFRSRAQSVNTVVHGPVTRHGTPRAVVGIAAGHNISSFVAWDDLPASGVASALAAGGFDRIDAEVPPGMPDHLLEIERADLGVTGASFALAESGSIVLSHGPGQGRVVSLIPEIHVALVSVSSIHRTLAHWAHEYPDYAAETANLVIVTGPSRTGDIELELTLGVHGPRHMHVVLIK